MAWIFRQTGVWCDIHLSAPCCEMTLTSTMPQPEEEEVEKGPGEAQCWSMPGWQKNMWKSSGFVCKASPVQFMMKLYKLVHYYTWENNWQITKKKKIVSCSLLSWHLCQHYVSVRQYNKLVSHRQLLFIIIHVPIIVTREWSVWMLQVAMVMERPRRRAAPCFTGGP